MNCETRWFEKTIRLIGKINQITVDCWPGDASFAPQLAGEPGTRRAEQWLERILGSVVGIRLRIGLRIGWRISFRFRFRFSFVISRRR